MRRRSIFPLVTLVATLLIGALTPLLASRDLPRNLATYKNARFGYQLAYPKDIFTNEREAPNDDGRMWTSADGRARLVTGAVHNSAQDTLEAYRRFLIEDTYAGAAIDYAPVKQSWFVLSGVKDAEIFYERVTFACRGKVIYGWQLTYPAAERALYDRIVEQIHRTYRAGSGEDGRC